MALAPQTLKGSTSYRLPAGIQPLLTTGTLQSPLNVQKRTGRLPVVVKPSINSAAASSSTVESLESVVDALRIQLDKITTLLEEEKRARTGKEPQS